MSNSNTSKSVDPIIKDILHWYNKQKYVRIGSDVSVTELMMAPQLVHLRDRYRPHISVTDLNMEIPALTGTALHSTIQKYLRMEAQVSGRWLIERKMCSIIKGQRVAGKFDALRDLEHLYDIKVTKTWKYIFGGVVEFEQQLNMYDYMLHLDGYSIKTLTIMMILLDWMPGKVWEKGYPQEKIQIIPIKKWPRKEQKDYIERRVDLWKGAKNKPDNKLPECTLDERWADKEVYKLYRVPTAKKSTKNFHTLRGAKSYQAVCHAKDPKGWANSKIKTFREKPWKRCETWCQVKDYCVQYRNR